jgi:hypothetical protein
MKFINQHSFFIFTGLLLLIAAVLVLRTGITTPRLLLLLGLLLIMAMLYLVLNPGGSSSREVGQIQSRIGSGTPVLLEFQSQY